MKVSDTDPGVYMQTTRYRTRLPDTDLNTDADANTYLEPDHDSNPDFFGKIQETKCSRILR